MKMAQLVDEPLSDSEKLHALVEYTVHLETERDAMQAEYEATFGELHEEISQWREAMKVIRDIAHEATEQWMNAEFSDIIERASAILNKYPIRLDGDGDAPGTDEQS